MSSAMAACEGEIFELSKALLAGDTDAGQVAEEGAENVLLKREVGRLSGCPACPEGGADSKSLSYPAGRVIDGPFG
jgi:hypothetical protein